MWTIKICNAAKTLASWREYWVSPPTKEDLISSLVLQGMTEVADQMRDSKNSPAYTCTKQLIDGKIFETKRVAFYVV